MSLRIRLDGRIFCAALNAEEEGDVYIDDDLHYELSVVKRVLVTTEITYHMANGGEWWWRGREPKDVPIYWLYYEEDPPQTHESLLEDVLDYFNNDNADFHYVEKTDYSFLFTWKKDKLKTKKGRGSQSIPSVDVLVFTNSHPNKSRKDVKLKIITYLSDGTPEPVFQGWVKDGEDTVRVLDSIGIIDLEK
jgi:hypothetical protein